MPDKPTKWQKINSQEVLVNNLIGVLERVPFFFTHAGGLQACKADFVRQGTLWRLPDKIPPRLLDSAGCQFLTGFENN
jgi:hypothetical protein